IRDTEAWEANAEPVAPAIIIAAKKFDNHTPPAAAMTSAEAVSMFVKLCQSGIRRYEKEDKTMKVAPPRKVTSKIARGMSRLGCFASSLSVETASKPRKDRHRIAAPVKSAPGPSSPVKATVGSGIVFPDTLVTVITIKAIAKMTCSTTTMPL